jgi:hypothetical protein
MIEKPEAGGQRCCDVVHDRLHPILHAIEDGVTSRQRCKVRLQLDADDGAAGDTRGDA